MEYDDQAAIDFIRDRLDADSNQRFDDDEILNVIDMIWDYYDDNGFLELDLDDDGPDDADVDDIIAYALKMVSKDKASPLTPDDVRAIVTAELEFEDSIEE